MATISLNQYEDAERSLARIEARRAVRAHAIIAVVVSIALIAVNILVAPVFPWSAFAVAGMGVGLAFHYFAGFLHVEEHLQAHQQQVELRAQGVR
jgi:hypothetical protein